MKSAHSNRLKDAPLSVRTLTVSRPVGTFALSAVVGAALLLIGNLILIGPIPDIPSYAIVIGMAAYLLAAILAGNRLSKDFPHAFLGLCNIATLGRLVIVGILFVALLAGLTPSWSTFALAMIALAFDGIDGWLARREGLASDFGARFDVEVDAAFALVLAVFAAVNGGAGYFVILLGLPYYLFILAAFFAPWLNKTLPESFARKTVCVFQIGTLIALQIPFLADGRLDLVIAAVAAALFWSFGRDILWLWRRRT